MNIISQFSVALTQLSCYRPKDTGTGRGSVFLNNNGCIFIEADGGTISAAKTVHASDDDCLNDSALLNNTAGCSFLYTAHDNVADIGISAWDICREAVAPQLSWRRIGLEEKRDGS